LETQKTTNSQGNTGQNKQRWRYHNTDFKIYHRAIAIKTAWYCDKNRYKDQWNRIEEMDMNPHSFTHLTFDNSTKNI
jgi:hypothetical protein